MADSGFLSVVRVIANAIWLVTGGFLTAIGWALFGAVLCVTVIGIPFGLQCFKAASITLLPFGRKIRLRYFSHPIANTLWVVFAGWEMFLLYLAGAAANFVTIVGIPAALAGLKVGFLSFAPFGAEID